MKDIEDIFREQFADAETQPPADAWQAIENRLPKRMALAVISGMEEIGVFCWRDGYGNGRFEVKEC